MSRPSTSNTDLGLLEEELQFQTALLKSLDGQEGIEEQREEITDKIKSLKRQVAKMHHPLPYWGLTNNSTNSDRSSSNQPVDDTAAYPYSIRSFFDPFLTNDEDVDEDFGGKHDNTMILPSRKRTRNEFDDEFDVLNMPNNKLLRTPTPGTASPANSVDSLDTDLSSDAILKKIFGKDYKEARRENQQAFERYSAERKREEQDAAIARELEREWNDSLDSSNMPQSNPKSVNYSQSFLNPDGFSFSSSVPPKLEIKPESTGQSNRSDTYQVISETSTPDSDDSGLVEISANDWTSKFGLDQQRNFSQARRLPSSYSSLSVQMPGAFPDLGYSYSSVPGTSVYENLTNGTSQYNSSTSSLGNPYNIFGNDSLRNGAYSGSSKMPFDVDRYPSPSGISFADPEQTQAEIKDLLKHIRPDEELTSAQLAEIQPEGLKVNLMPHQRKGFAWLKSMEEGTNKGGILADDMGLGKTVQALALVLSRPPLDEDGRRLQRPTLIVAPVALMQQWEREIQKMVHRSHRLNVLILHGTNRNSLWSDIRSYDVVLTTYGLLASDLKRREVWENRLKLVPDATPSPQQRCPVLGKDSKFHRVILDEAQNIKNKSTRAAAAACRIEATYRWCLSGTPMQNSVDEIYSLIKFCRIRPYNDFDKFSKDIGRPLKARGVQYGRDKAMKQLQALLRAVLLRRTKKSEIDGQPILQLPDKHTVEDRAIFSKDELDFYKALETQAQIQFNRFLKNGTVGRHYSHALVLLLRLRQCCCSPQLVTNAKDFLVNGALQDLDYVENARLLSKEVIRRLGDLEAFECPICMDAVENPVIFNPCGHSLCQECLSTMVDKAMADSESNKVNCPHCRAQIDTNKVTDHESFLRVHFPDRPGVKPLDEKDGEENDDEAETTDSDSSDDIEDEEDDDEDLKDFVVPDGSDVEYDTDASESLKKHTVKKSQSNEDLKIPDHALSKSDIGGKKKSKSKDKKAKGKGKKKTKPDIRNLAQLRVEGLRNKAAKKKYLRRLGRGYQQSTKIEKTIRLLKEIRERGEGEKTIIFSSFTSFLDLLEVGIVRADDDFGTYTRYDGSMSAKDRNSAVNRFTDDPRCTAILVSLKAGNAGLNLTAANHVIILDPFWNPFVEHQAADRCYRIGQTREVTIHRVLIGEGDEDGNLVKRPKGSEREFTVEDRILALQEKKRELVETALDEKASGNIGRLGVRELGYLFGVNSING